MTAITDSFREKTLADARGSDRITDSFREKTLADAHGPDRSRDRKGAICDSHSISE